QPVHVTGPESLTGQEISVQIAAALPNSLAGTLVAGSSPAMTDGARAVTRNHTKKERACA
ncbi:MAG TPA: hypothetical protein VFE12_11125, partial [Acetobacteraceae bacterium]|nr:hypothetical protein [Acetobacteraceae bacterium]